MIYATGGEAFVAHRTNAVTRVVRHTSLGAVLAWMALCSAVTIDEDTWGWLFFGVPWAVVLLDLLTHPRLRVPSSALFATGTTGGAWTWFTRPYLRSLGMGCATGLAGWLGAAVSWKLWPGRGAGALVFGPDEYLGRNFPPLATAMGVSLGYLTALAVLQPITVAVDALRQRRTDPSEALRLTAYPVFVAAIGCALAALFLAFPDGNDHAEAPIEFVATLVGQTPVGTSRWAPVLAWTGVACALCGVALRWLASRVDASRDQSS